MWLLFLYSCFLISITKFLMETAWGRKDLAWLIVRRVFGSSWQARHGGRNGSVHGGTSMGWPTESRQHNRKKPGIACPQEHTPVIYFLHRGTTSWRFYSLSKDPATGDQLSKHTNQWGTLKTQAIKVSIKQQQQTVAKRNCWQSQWPRLEQAWSSELHRIRTGPAT